MIRSIDRTRNIADIEALARKRLPRMIFDFIQGGAEDEVTLAGNRSEFERWGLAPRVLRDVGRRDQSTTILGGPVSSPIGFAPVGFTGIVEPRERELSVARAAARHGIAYALSSSATVTLEEVADVSEGQLWFQLYVWRDRGLTQSVVERARDAGYRVLCLTVDVPVVGRRERDIENGMTIPPRIRPRAVLDVSARPSWLWRFLRYHVLGKSITFANFVDDRSEGLSASASELGAFVNAQFDPGVTWEDVGWLKDLWGGPVVVKGVLRPDDARRCVDAGADGIVVSNHGGRQLDGAIPSLAALRTIASTVRPDVELFVDGGIRRGVDVLKALALGAQACFVGRPYVYGLAAAGERGVGRVIELLKEDLDRSMALCGVTDISSVTAELLVDLQSDLGATPAQGRLPTGATMAARPMDSSADGPEALDG